MLNNKRRAGNKAAARRNSVLQRCAHHIDFANVNSEIIRDTLAQCAERPKRKRLIENHAQKKAILQFDERRQRTYIAVLAVQAFDDEEAPRGLCLFRVLS